MTSDTIDEIIIRIKVGSESPELLQRLAGFKRPSIEALHLLRMAVQYEKMLNSGLTTAHVEVSTEPVVVPRTVKTVKSNAKIKPALTEQAAFLSKSGFTSDCFAGPPG